MQSNEELRQVYQTTWETWTHKLEALQCLVDKGQPDRVAIEAAVLELERARLAHNSARDRLAEQMFGGFERVPASRAGGWQSQYEQEERVREAAHLLWELSGRPQGTAQYDWIRAEHLVRSAAAASLS
jgi:hypothetical protein